ncbi:MAG: ATP-grasp domain-containing protein [bacterium]
MRLYENESKKIFTRQGIPVPGQLGIICRSKEVKKVLKESDFPVMLKSLILVGGRGKAGGIKKANNVAEAERNAKKILKMRIKGYPVEMLMLEKAVVENSAVYLGVTMNPETYNNIIIVSPSGGVDIETVANETPELIFRLELKENEKILPDAAAQNASDFLTEHLDTDAQFNNELKDIISILYNTYQKLDCKTAEINPLIITPEGPVAADAKIVLDDNALFRQKEVFGLLGIKEVRHDVSEPTRNEVRAREAGFPYVDLLSEDHKKDNDKLYVGLVPGGAGYGIFSIDEVANVGERFFDGRVIPVNFMDSGGGPSLEKVAEMFHLLMDYKIVDLIITSRFGGISSCDTFIKGLIQAILDRFRSGRRMIPVYGRMVGTDLPSAREYLDKAKQRYSEELKDMDITVGNKKIMAEVIREGIEKAFNNKERKS